MAKGKIKTPFKDSAAPTPSPKPSKSDAKVNGEPGLPGRTKSSNAVDEVVRC